MVNEVVEASKSLRTNTFLFRLVLGGVVGIVVSVFVFWEDIQHFLGKQTAAVTSATLTDTEVQVNAKILAKEVVHELL